MEKGVDLRINIGLVGNSSVGKTSLIRKYAYKDKIS